ncbi:dethiobiotin synthase [Micrococcoides hystricis]|uniref:ATP-dependent dethiobiotin synthetase BioD n=1 Tax=Micrococcoides hystricis TaxID=1572761 RepID=A0ABV6P7W8_9MICC
MIFAVTGTDTEIGKTVVTAMFAAAALEAGKTVAVYKPTQTGVGPEDAGDVDSVAGWLGSPEQLTTAEGVRLIHPMAPVDALRHQEARQEGQPAAEAGTSLPVLPTLQEHAATIQTLAAQHDVVFVEGAGGLLVKLTEAGETIAELAQLVRARPIVVARPNLGTLNHTELTLEAADRRGLNAGVLVLGSWPAKPDALHEINRRHLTELAGKFGWAWAPGPAAGAVIGSAEQVEATLRGAGQKLLQVPGLFGLPGKS